MGVNLLGAASRNEQIRKTASLFFDYPAKQQVSISPDGSHVIFIATAQNGFELGSYSFADSTMKTKNANDNFSRAWYYWLNSDTLIYHSVREKAFSIRIGEDLENDLRFITKPVVNFLRFDSEKVMTHSGQSTGGSVYVYEEGIWDSSSKKIGRFNEDTFSWLVDTKSQLRVAIERAENSGYKYYHRWDNESPWQSLDLPYRAWPITMSPKGDGFLLYVKEEGYEVLKSYHIAKKQLSKALIKASGFDVDVGSLLYSPDHKAIWGIRYHEAKPQTVYFDRTLRELGKTIEAVFPDQDHIILGQAITGEWLFRIQSDVQSPEYYTLFPSESLIKPFAKTRPAIDATQLQKSIPIEIPPTDSTPKLHGYWVPAQSKVQAPAIVMAHDGPYRRYTWGFHEVAHFFSQLGYHVILLNYQGSVGYGSDYRLETFLEITKQVPHDLAATVSWAAQQPEIDASRIALYGKGFGAFASIAALQEYPKLFKCSGGHAGIYDWSRYWSKRMRGQKLGGVFPLGSSNRELLKWERSYIGDIIGNLDNFKNVSPILYVDKIEKPLFLSHGKVDTRVDKWQTYKLSERLIEANKIVEEHIYDEVGQSFRRREDEIEHFTRLAQFFDKHLLN